MKKKLLLSIFAGIFVAACAAAFSACTGCTFHKHFYTYKITMPTCTEQGYTTYTCRCGDTYVDKYTDPQGHSFTEYISSKDATCTANRIKTYQCVRCTATEDREVANTATGHSFTVYTFNGDATCEVDGTETATCDHGCGEEDTRTAEDSALGHSFTVYMSNGDATCEEDGTETATCDHGCGKTDKRTDEDSALGHSFTVYTSNGDATCEEDGTKTATCDHGCGKTDKRTDEGSALGHSFTVYVAERTPATCTDNRIDTYRCERCTATEDREIADSALGHSFTVYTSNGDATCEEDGTETATCGNGCGKTDTRTAEGSALGHSFTDYIYNDDATYVADGTKTADCDNGCGESDTITADGTMLASRIEFATLAVEDTNASGNLRYATETFDFNDEIIVYGVYTYTVTGGLDGNESYSTKVVPLQEGENIFYVTTMDGANAVKRYTVTLYRNRLYTVSFDVAGGTAVDSQQVEEGYLATQPTSEKTGYNLTWDYDFTTPITCDTMITAVWTLTQYTITYHYYGTTTETSSYTMETETFELPTAERTGYVFNGWREGSTSGEEVTHLEKGSTGEREYYAKWTIIWYTITYVYDENTTTTAEYTVQSTLALPTPAPKTGYSFEGWYTSETGGSKVSNIAPGRTGDITCYARWKATSYTITYNYNEETLFDSEYTKTNDGTYPWADVGGVLRSTNKGDSKTSTYTIRANVTLTLNFDYKVSSEEDYDWFYIKKGSTQLVKVSGVQTAYTSYSVSLSAGETLTFVYDKDGADSAGDDCVYIRNLTFTKSVQSTIKMDWYTVETPTFSLMTPTRTGYTFVGWYTAKVDGEKVTQIEQGTTGNKTYYARWEVN